jgi:hypothetical protein
MNTTILIGLAASLFGASTIILRHSHPHLFKKFGLMKAQFGDTAGYIVHFVAYSAVPLIFGIVMVLNGLNGSS